MKKRIFGYVFFFLFQMFGAVLSAEIGNYVMVGWCTGWAVYAIVQLEKLSKQSKLEDNTDMGA